ncbi:MAG: hypothetical protein JJLCMIEE_00884 [Acidimicrobiales bacterium]|nr:hypothetical protein [Acidimicrobiales bacterium]
MTEPEILSAPLVLEFPFSRTTGPVIGAFLTGLREKTVVGMRGADGRVICPAVEYDPETGAPLTELVELSDTGTVTSWTWVSQPRQGQPFARPFAFALVQIDGADTAMAHAVDVADATEMSTGMRVRARWAVEREGLITDIECFEPELAR